MAIKSRKMQQIGQIKSQVNLQKLLLPTEFHPEGRVKLDPKTHMPSMPKRNVLYKDNITKYGKDVEIEVNGGHALKEGSVWRVALGGPARYIWKILRDEMKYRIEGPDRRGRKGISAPTLMQNEMYEARLFITFLLHNKDQDILPNDFLAAKYDNKMVETFDKINNRFYDWRKKQETEPELANLNDVFVFLPV